MLHRGLFTIACLALLAVPTAAGSQPIEKLNPAEGSFSTNGSGGSLSWSSDHDSSLERAKKAGRPVVLYFTMNKCPACKTLDNGAFSDSNVQRASKGLVLCKITLSKSTEDLCKRYSVRSFPTVLFLNPDGRRVGKLGSRKPDSVAYQLRKLKSDHVR